MGGGVVIALNLTSKLDSPSPADQDSEAGV